jgi:transcriptional regulator with XRE-family HTH domain
MSKGKKVKAINPPNFDEPISLELIAQAIKARRTQLGLDIKTASMLSGVSLVTFSKIENASKGIRLDSVLKIAKALGIEFKILDWSKNG